MPTPVSEPTDAGSLLLEVDDLARSYGHQQVFAKVCLHQRGPGFVAVTGSNGTGKTTLLRVLAQLTRPDSGIVRICGRDPFADRQHVVRGLVGWVPDTAIAYGDLSVEANLRLAGRLAGLRRQALAHSVFEALAAWQLDDHADRPVRSLSRGWRQRYNLARGTLHAPQVLLLDEPTDGLDEAGVELLDSDIAVRAGDRIVLAASHDRGWLARHATQWLQLDSAVPPVRAELPVLA